jgi:hypothetical protein
MNTKKRYLSICVMALCLVMAPCLVMPLSFVTGNAIAADTDQLLFSMAKKIAETQQFSVTMHMGYDVVQESGQKIEFSEIREVLIDRPNHLRTNAEQSDGDIGQFIFDGKAITLFSATENVYAQTDRPGDLDSAIRYAVSKMGVRVPLARILLSTFPAELERLTVEVDYVEHNTLGTTPTDHIAGQLEDIDYQIWIAEDLFPRRIVMTYKNAPGQPQFWAEFSDWNLKPEISAETFVFSPPKGAEKILTLLPAIKAEAASKTQGGS